MNYEKILFTSFTSFGMVLCMFATNIILPAMPVMGDEYHMSSAMINLIITSYMVIQGISPALLSIISDVHGRCLAWMLALSLYTVANVGLALQTDFVALVLLRCLQSIGSSCAIPFGFAVAADITSPSERGRFIGPMHGSVMGAFAFGPVIGGTLTTYLGWRSIFWFLSISSGLFLSAYVLFMPETARAVVGDGSVAPRRWWTKPVFHNTKRLQHDAAQRPAQPQRRRERPQTALHMIFASLRIIGKKDAFVLIMYTSLLYFGVSALWSTTANHFGQRYGLSTLYLGLSFMPYGILGGLGMVISGTLLDYNYRRLSKQHGMTSDHPSSNPNGFSIKISRLQVAMPFMFLLAFSFTAYGWIVQEHLPLAAVLVFQALIGLGSTPLLGIIYTLLIDLFPDQTATVSGVADLIRCLFGAISAAVIDYMLVGMGWGWCFTLLGLTLLLSLCFVAFMLFNSAL
ncbi:major facilitator superfamily domain-containing protein [Aspergillus pseudonomiae]|nr:major facilitator superfamily domain-containing protein [Aspergillus pseudonomiae]